MPDVIDDMDDMFKKAGENYPLNTDSSDWNEVYKNLQSSVSHANPALQEKKTTRRFLLWLLLLIPFGGMIYEYNYPPDENKIAKNKVNRKKENKNEFAVPNKQMPKELNNGTAAKEKSTGKNIITKSNKESNVRDKGAIAKAKNVAIKNDLPAGKVNKTENNFYLKKSNLIATDNSKIETLLSTENETASGNIENITDDITHTKTTNHNELTVSKKYKTDTALNVNEASKNMQPEKNTNPFQPMSDSLKLMTAKASKKVNKIVHKQKHIYAGIIAGPDISTIKFQKTMKTSYTLGILAGYKLAKKWSIETGLYWDKKNYYSTGKYFNTAKTTIPSYYKVEDLDGSCRMIEWPVNVKYDFEVNKKNTWFALAGVSSYIMKKEDYNYRYKYYGILVDKKVSYKNSTKNWASILNLSGGYSRKLGKTSTVRIEPYIKIPFMGVGIGSLPIMSSGVYVGFTKTLF